MTDEQTPTGEQPPEPTQDPTQPLAPSSPPQGPPPPVNPYNLPPEPASGAPAPAPAAYGQAPPPQYDQPMATYPAAPAGKPSKAMAIVALILALLVCVPFLTAVIALVLGVIVLVRSTDAVNRGKGLAVAAIVIAVLAIVGWAAFIAAIKGGVFEDVFDDFLPVENLSTGECITATNLADPNEAFVGDITEVPCTEPHDGEVLTTITLTQDDARDYDAQSTSLCADTQSDPDIAAKLTPDLGYFGLTDSVDPNAGDNLACIAFRTDGQKLDAPL